MLSNIPSEVHLGALIAALVLAALSVVFGVTWIAIRAKKSGARYLKRMLILLLSAVIIAAASWILNMGWYRFILTLLLVPFTHGIAFLFTNVLLVRHFDESRKLRILNLLFILSYVLVYVLSPDGGDIGEMYFFFGLIESDFWSNVASYVAGAAFCTHILSFILQIVEVGRIKKKKRSSEEA